MTTFGPIPIGLDPASPHSGSRSSSARHEIFRERVGSDAEGPVYAIDQRGPVTYLIYAATFLVAGKNNMYPVHSHRHHVYRRRRS